MAHRLAPEALVDLEDIAFDIAKASDSLGLAERFISTIAERFHLLSRYPYLGRDRDHDLGKGRRSLSVSSYVIIYRIDDGDVQILRVLHGRRDIENLFR